MAFIHSARLYSNAVRSAQALERARVALATIQRGVATPGAYGLSADEGSILRKCCAGIESALADFATRSSPPLNKPPH